MQPGNNILKRLSSALLLFAIATGLCLPHLCQAAIDEGRVRAAVILHIIALTQLPEPTVTPDQPLRMVVLGQDPGRLADILNAKMNEPAASTGKMVRASSFAAYDKNGETETFANALRDCQVLYLTKDGMRYLPQLSALLTKRPILTIGETEEFCQNGDGMVCLTIKAQKLAIHINRKLAIDAGFHFGAELLRHAVLVDK